MTRREALKVLSLALIRTSERLPANNRVKWLLGSNLWNYFPRVPFTDILDVMKDTGFFGLRLTQFPQILNTYGLTQAQIEKETSRRGCAGCHRVLKSISFQGWPIVDLDIARHVPRASYERCGAYVVSRLEPIYE